MIGSLFIALAVLCAGARAQWPLSAAQRLDEILFARAIYETSIIAVNANNSNQYILDCSENDDPCSIAYIFPETGIFNIANVASFNGETVILSGNVGILYTYSCNSTTLICEEGEILKTSANSDPFTIVYDDFIETLFYASYSNYNGSAAVFVIDCEEPTACYVREILNNFAEDCFDAYDDECFALDITGPPTSLAASWGALVIGFPQANNNRGTALLYDCFESPCLIQIEVSNPYDINDFEDYQSNQLYGKSLGASSISEGSFRLAIGVPNMAYPEYDGDYVSNLYSGGVYSFTCSFGEGWDCSYDDVLDSYDDYDSPCPLLNKDFGQFVHVFDEQVIVGAPTNCNGEGAVYINFCTPDCFTDDYDTTGYYYYGDSYGSDLIASADYYVSNGIGSAFINDNYYIVNANNNTKYAPSISVKKEGGRVNDIILKVESRRERMQEKPQPSISQKKMERIQARKMKMTPPLAEKKPHRDSDLKVIKKKISELKRQIRAKKH